MAYSIHHRFAIYRKWQHFVLPILLFALPLGLILLVGLANQLPTGALINGLSLSLYRLVLAYLISLILALVLAITLGQGRLGDFFIPIFDLLQNVPSFALIPIFLLWFGNSNTMAIIFATSSIIWPILFYLLTAIKTLKTDWTEAALIFGATGWKRIVYYLIPASLPAIVTGSIVGLSIGWEAIIGIEIISLGNGIGGFLNSSQARGSQAILIFGIAALLAVVLVINKIVWAPLIKKTIVYGD